MAREAVETWVVPAVSVAAIAVFWALSALDVWPDSVAVVGIAGALMFLVLFSAFRDFFFSSDEKRRNVSLAFCGVWFLGLFASLFLHIFPGNPVAAGVLKLGSGSIDVPGPGLRSIVVDGKFVAAEGQGNRLGHYRLQASDPSGSPQIVEGDFEDSFAHQRVGRRGSATVEIQHTAQRHLVRVGEHTTLTATDVDKTLEPVLSVMVYPALSPWVLSLFGLVGIVATLVLEHWLEGDGTALMAVAVTFFVVDQYERWGSPHPQLKSLVGAILVGSFIGAPLAAIGWRVIPKSWTSFAR